MFRPMEMDGNYFDGDYESLISVFCIYIMHDTYSYYTFRSVTVKSARKIHISGQGRF